MLFLIIRRELSKDDLGFPLQAKLTMSAEGNSPKPSNCNNIIFRCIQI